MKYLTFQDKIVSDNNRILRLEDTTDIVASTATFVQLPRLINLIKLIVSFWIIHMKQIDFSESLILNKIVVALGPRHRFHVLKTKTCHYI